MKTAPKKDSQRDRKKRKGKEWDNRYHKSSISVWKTLGLEKHNISTQETIIPNCSAASHTEMTDH